MDSNGWIHVPEQEAEVILARLQALSAAAKTFGSAVAERDIDVAWRTPSEEGSRHDSSASARSVEVDLERAAGLLGSPPADARERHAEVFKAGFLHRLGHILFSEPGIEASRNEAALAAAAGTGPQWSTALSDPRSDPILSEIWVTLEEGRVDRRLMDRFHGARQYLEGHRERARALAAAPAEPSRETPGHGAVTRLAAGLFLLIWQGGNLPEDLDLDPETQTIIDRLRPSLGRIAREGSAAELRTWVEEELAPELESYLTELPEDSLLDADLSHLVSYLPNAQQEGTETEVSPEAPSRPPEPGERRTPTQPGREGEDAEEIEEDEAAGTAPSTEERPGTQADTPSDDRPVPVADQAVRDYETAALPDLSRQLVSSGSTHALTSEPIIYPHTDGTMVVDEIPVGDAYLIPQSDRVAGVPEKVHAVYGPPALDAFNRHSASLRQALQVNYERSYSGRYRTGRRVGLRNVRRMMSTGDIRLFQRLEVPDRLSYYFHLLVDISPSMYTHDNLHKAIAAGYGFASVLTRVRVPVDVSLYSSSVVRLYDHSCDVLDEYFGRRYGFLSAGTCEIEAIAHAKILADRVSAHNKLIAVITDGIPNGPALGRSGSGNLRDYYTNHLVPWLERSGIDLLSLNLADAPTYHPNTVRLTREWDSLWVLGDVLDEIIREGRRRHEGLWE